MHINCFSPTEKFEPSASISTSNPASSSIKYAKPIKFNWKTISSSEYSPKGSIFSLKVPSINFGSWGIKDILSLNNFKSILDISTSSINIFPLEASKIRNNAKHKVVFPLPVLPTIPIFSPGFIVQFIFFKTKSV